MFDKDASFEYHVFKDYGITFDEKQSSCGTLRLVQWVKNGAEPDESKAKIEIRKIKIDPEGETKLKGYAFGTEEGPHELVEGMVEVGFGDTKKILKSVRKREDFMEAATTINNDDSDNGGSELFDMRDLLKGVSEEDIEED